MLQFCKNIYNVNVGRNSAVILTVQAASAMRLNIHAMKSTVPGLHFGAFRLNISIIPLYTNHIPINTAVVTRRTQNIGSVVSIMRNCSPVSEMDPHSS